VAAEVAAGHKRAADWRVILRWPTPIRRLPGWGSRDRRARQRHRVQEGRIPWVSERPLTLARPRGGFTKLLFDPDNHRVLGGGIVGSNAGELISEIALAVETVATAPTSAHDSSASHAHRDDCGAAEAFEGTLTDLYLPKK